MINLHFHDDIYTTFISESVVERDPKDCYLFSPTLFSIYSRYWALRFLACPSINCRTRLLGFSWISQHLSFDIKMFQQKFVAQIGFKPGTLQLPSHHASSALKINMKKLVISMSKYSRLKSYKGQLISKYRGSSNSTVFGTHKKPY